MSKPAINPDKTNAGIAVDPHTLERVVPESKRPDGSVRKQLKIRPGFTPQEDISRFRGSRQAQMDANALPKGHIVGWVAPTAAQKQAQDSKPLSKSAKKNAKRKEKREEKKNEIIKDSWEDDEDEAGTSSKAESTPVQSKSSSSPSAPDQVIVEPSSKAIPSKPNADSLSEDMDKLQVK